MDDNGQTTRICDQCHKEVSEVNFDLHESHCRRFLTLCPDCDEPVPKDSMDTHRSEQHTQVKCVLCKQTMERCRLVDHESDECEERLVCCEYCQLAVPWRTLEGHSVACGSRTERCDDCGRYVTLKGRAEHARTCPDIYSAGAGSRDDGKGAAGSTGTDTADNGHLSVICLKCQKPFPAEQIDEHELECPASSDEEDLENGNDDDEEVEDDEEEEEEDQTPWLMEHLKGASFSDRPRQERDFGGDPDQISACPHCHLALPLGTLLWHETKCQIHVNLK